MKMKNFGTLICARVCVCECHFQFPHVCESWIFFSSISSSFFLIVPTEKKNFSHFFLSFKTFIHSFILAFFYFYCSLVVFWVPFLIRFHFFYIVVFFCFVANHTHTHTQCFIEHLNFFFIFVHFKMNEWIKKKMNTNNEYGMHILAQREQWMIVRYEMRQR